MVNECSFQNCSAGGIVKGCYPGSSENDTEDFVCDCSNWYGFVGEECDQAALQVWYYRGALLTLALWSLGILVTMLIAITKHLVAVKPKLKSLDAAFYAAVANLLSSTAVFFSTILDLPQMFDPSLFKVFTVGTLGFVSEDIGGPYGRAVYSFYSLASMFYFIAALQISLSWVNVANSVSKFESKSKSDLFHTTLFAKWGTGISLVTIIVLLVTNDRVLAYLLIMVMIPFYVWFSFRSRKRFTSVLKRTASKSGVSKQYRRPLRLVRRSNGQTISILFFLFILLVIYITVRDLEDELISVGSFNYFTLHLHFLIGGGLALLTSNSFYLLTIFKGMRSHIKKPSRVPSVQQHLTRMNSKEQAYETSFEVQAHSMSNQSTKIVQPVEQMNKSTPVFVEESI